MTYEKQEELREGLEVAMTRGTSELDARLRHIKTMEYDLRERQEDYNTMIEEITDNIEDISLTADTAYEDEELTSGERDNIQSLATIFKRRLEELKIEKLYGVE